MSTGQELWKEVVANQKKLRACKRHSFGAVLDGHINHRFECTSCGGRMYGPDILNYARGYKAADGNPDDVAMFNDGSSIE